MSVSKALLSAATDLRAAMEELSFSAPVSHVYNPLDYAWKSQRLYLTRYANSRKRIVLLGMNPGPFGMTQTGVPFGEIAAVRDWMNIETPVGKPVNENPKRPVQGFDCPKSEVSGRRLWGLMAERFQTPERFFKDHLVLNYCPLVFMEESGRNVTPDKLSAADKKPLDEACDAHLRVVLETLQPEWCIGIGKFAEAKLKQAAPDGAQVGFVLHPSPASPAANRGWAEAATRQFQKLGVWN